MEYISIEPAGKETAGLIEPQTVQPIAIKTPLPCGGGEPRGKNLWYAASAKRIKTVPVKFSPCRSDVDLAEDRLFVVPKRNGVIPRGNGVFPKRDNVEFQIEN